MAKDPAFLFYYDRFLSGTISMSDNEVGQYIRLMCIQANKGHVTKKDMLHICGTLVNDVCLRFTPKGEDKFVNLILDEICNQRRTFTESRRNNRKGNKCENHDHTSKTSEQLVNNTSNTSVSHMVNVNVNKDVDVFINKKELSKIEIIEGVLNDQIFIEGIQQAHKGKDLKQAFEECYIHHSNAPNPPNEIWMWKQKFNTWLTIKKTNKANESGKTIDKGTAHSISLMEDYQQRNGKIFN